jgi:hypothetical protein
MGSLLDVAVPAQGRIVNSIKVDTHVSSRQNDLNRRTACVPVDFISHGENGNQPLNCGGSSVS